MKLPRYSSRKTGKSWFATGFVLTCIILTGVACTAPQPVSGNTSTSLRRFTNSIGMTFVLIPAGEFDMGSPEYKDGHLYWEGPIHRVQISRPFWIGTHEATQGQYEKIMRRKSSRYIKTWNPQLAMSDVNWHDAVQFCERLSHQENKRYRLPTEAEWEYACRAGTNTAWFFGDSPEMLSHYAVCETSDPKPEEPASIGTLKPNPWGLYDVYGNVWEWVSDKVLLGVYGGGSGHQFDPAPYPLAELVVNPAGMERGEGRITRGGSFDYPTKYCRSAARLGNYPNFSFNNHGFRVVCDLKDTSSQNSD